ncbi:MAG: hypothetical protein NTY83_03305 [Candidatus Micrarchaeota archaeon]|nr:hypothetical protein [Candidatus Micrarchaeota archaeon]
MTTKPPHEIPPMSHDHVRWAIRDILKDPGGPLKGMKMPEALSGGRPDAQAVVDLLSSCGIRRGAKEFFSRVLENADEDAELVDRHIAGYGKELNLAAKSLVRIIVVNTREEKPDMEMEPALFACIGAAEKMRGRDSGLALSFLEFCGSAAFGSEHLKKVSQYCGRDEVIETALSIKQAPVENTGSVIEEFFLAIHQVACNIKEEHEIEGTLRFFLEACLTVSEKCPQALYSFIYYFCNSSWESVEEGLLYIGLYTSPGVLQAFSSMGKNYTRIAELADECFNIAKSAANRVEDGCDGIHEAVSCFSDAIGKLGGSWPAATIPFARYFHMLLKDNKLGNLQRLADNFTSTDTLGVLEDLKDDPRMQLAFMEACYIAAVGTEPN